MNTTPNDSGITIITVTGEKIDCNIEHFEGTHAAIIRNDTDLFINIKVMDKDNKEIKGGYHLHTAFKSDIVKRSSTIGQLDNIPLRPKSFNVLMF